MFMPKNTKLSTNSTIVPFIRNLLLNLRSPSDYVVRSSVLRSFAPVVCVR